MYPYEWLIRTLTNPQCGVSFQNRIAKPTGATVATAVAQALGGSFLPRPFNPHPSSKEFDFLPACCPASFPGNKAWLGPTCYLVQAYQKYNIYTNMNISVIL